MSQIDFSGGKRSAAFPLLTDEHIELLRRFGQEQTFEAGDMLFRPGDPTTDFFVVLEGRVAIIDDYGRPDERLIVEHGPRSFLGEFNAISGQPTLFTAVAREAGRALTVPLHDLRTLIASEATLSNVVLGALLGRRALLIQRGRRRADHRLALLAGHAAPARVRRAEPSAARVDRRRDRPRRRGAPARPERHAGGDAGRPARRARVQQPDEPGVRAPARLRARRPITATSTTCSSSAAARPGSPRPSTARRKGCPRS